MAALEASQRMKLARIDAERGERERILRRDLGKMRARQEARYGRMVAEPERYELALRERVREREGRLDAAGRGFQRELDALRGERAARDAEWRADRDRQKWASAEQIEAVRNKLAAYRATRWPISTRARTGLALSPSSRLWPVAD